MKPFLTYWFYWASLLRLGYDIYGLRWAGYLLNQWVGEDNTGMSTMVYAMVAITIGRASSSVGCLK
jgi:hypothetical protein